MGQGVTCHLLAQSPATCHLPPPVTCHLPPATPSHMPPATPCPMPPATPATCHLPLACSVTCHLLALSPATCHPPTCHLLAQSPVTAVLETAPAEERQHATLRAAHQLAALLHHSDRQQLVVSVILGPSLGGGRRQEVGQGGWARGRHQTKP